MKKNQTIAVFANSLQKSIEDVATLPIRWITRPHLIDIVEKLEEMTGKILCRENERQPLAWLDDKNVTFRDISDYFADDVTTGRIYDIIKAEEDAKTAKRIQQAPTKETIREKFASLLHKVDGKVPEVSDDMLIRSADYAFPGWKDNMYFLEEDLASQLPANLDAVIGEKTTFSEFVALF